MSDEIVGAAPAATETETPQQPSEVTPQAGTNEKDEVLLKKEEQLSNVRKAIAEANEELRRLRAVAREEKAPKGDALPEIDFKDPSAQAWDKHMADKVSPLREEIEQEKREIRTFALQTFLQDKPALASDADKVKELVALYDKIRTATERTSEGVLLDLNRAYAALNADTLIAAARGQRVASAQAEAALSDIAVSRGASSMQTPKKTLPVLSDEDKAVLAKWGMSPEEWIADREKYK